jgi:hypothetical protein
MPLPAGTCDPLSACAQPFFYPMYQLEISSFKVNSPSAYTYLELSMIHCADPSGRAA